ncbi:MAG: OmpH family outer membrane protein [Verrucomicrobiae bacterium]|nr:OmpH family outer membrane protein [Verrucomicrobiae bacterium]
MPQSLTTRVPVLLLCLVLPPAFAAAQAEKSPAAEKPAVSRKIAVIDLARAFEAHPDTKTATDQLTKDRDAARDVFKEKSEALKVVLQDHQELIRAGKKTEAGEKLKRANELEKQIATLRTTQQRDLEEKFRQTKHRILDAIRKAVAEYNAEGQYAVVLDKSAESAFALPAVVDASGADDITEAIIAKLKKTAAP